MIEVTVKGEGLNAVISIESLGKGEHSVYVQDFCDKKEIGHSSDDDALALYVGSVFDTHGVKQMIGQAIDMSLEHVF